MRKGQVFILSAIVFSSFILLTVYSYGDFVEGGEETYFRQYFSDSMDVPVESFDEALQKNLSSTYIERRVYNSHRFIDRQSQRKGIDYRGLNYILLPYSGKGLVINYGDSLINTDIQVDGSWSNLTLESMQSKQISLPEGKFESRIKVKSLGIDREFNVSNSRMFVWSKMEDDSETWVNTRLH